MAESGAVESSGGQRKLRIHPLAITSICDHYTRVVVGGSQQQSPEVIGLLFGVQNGLEVSIYDASEAVFRKEDGQIKLDEQHVEKKKALFVAVYPQYELLGWYTVGEKVLESYLLIHRQISSFNESPLFVLMNPNPSPDDRVLPVSIYESEMHLVSDVPTMMFVQLSFSLETAQAEQISVEEVARSTPTDAASALDKHAVGLRTSLRTLKTKVATVVEYLKAARAHQVEVDYGLLRRVAKLSHELSAIDAATIGDAFEHELTDAMVVTYLAAVTKASHALAEISEKYTMAFGDRLSRFAH